MQVKPTRMELLTTKKKIKLASRGHKLLKEKRDALMMQFMSLLREIKELRHNLTHNMKKANDSMLNAEALEGSESITELYEAEISQSNIELGQKNVMGVKLPYIANIGSQHRWYSFIEHSLELDNAVIRYRELLPKILELAEKQLALKRIGDDIKSTKRKVNSLEYLIIPSLEKKKSFISFRLNELERENFARLKLIKSKLSKNAAE